MTYVALLRGINVGGNRRSTCDSSRRPSSTRHARRRTYINSGNVIFNSDAEKPADSGTPSRRRSSPSSGFR